MYKKLSILFAASTMLIMVGCSSATKSTDEDGAAGAGSDTRSGADLGSGANAQATGSGAQDLASKNVIYFAFDSSDISAEDREVIAAHAKKINGNPGLKVVLEGHADERGTREYNIALGERRAKSVQQLLQVQGVDLSRVQVISFGEERPAAMGHDEQAWSLNRRVEFLYTGS